MNGSPDERFHAVLGRIDPRRRGLHEGSFDVAGKAVDVQLELERDGVPLAAIDAFQRLVDGLSARLGELRARLVADMEAGAEHAACVYFTHHLDELDDDTLAELFGTSERHLVEPTAFAAALVPKSLRVALYHGDEDATLDLTLPGEVTDYVLAVRIAVDGSIVDVDMES